MLLLQSSAKPQLEGHFDGEIYILVISVLSAGLAGRVIMAGTKTQKLHWVDTCHKCLYHWLNSHFTRDVEGEIFLLPGVTAGPASQLDWPRAGILKEKN